MPSVKGLFSAQFFSDLTTTSLKHSFVCAPTVRCITDVYCTLCLFQDALGYRKVVSNPEIPLQSGAELESQMRWLNRHGVGPTRDPTKPRAGDSGDKIKKPMYDHTVQK